MHMYVCINTKLLGNRVCHCSICSGTVQKKERGKEVKSEVWRACSFYKRELRSIFNILENIRYWYLTISTSHISAILEVTTRAANNDYSNQLLKTKRFYIYLKKLKRKAENNDNLIEITIATLLLTTYFYQVTKFIEFSVIITDGTMAKLCKSNIEINCKCSIFKNSPYAFFMKASRIEANTVELRLNFSRFSWNLIYIIISQTSCSVWMIPF